MTQNEDWLDNALGNEHFTAVTDQGFTTRVMARLPAHRGPHRWIVPLASLIGASCACLPIAHKLAQMFHRSIDQPSLELLVVPPIALVWAMCAWVLTESK